MPVGNVLNELLIYSQVHLNTTEGNKRTKETKNFENND